MSVETPQWLTDDIEAIREAFGVWFVIHRFVETLLALGVMVQRSFEIIAYHALGGAEPGELTDDDLDWHLGTGFVVADSGRMIAVRCRLLTAATGLVIAAIVSRNVTPSVSPLAFWFTAANWSLVIGDPLLGILDALRSG